MQYVAFLRAINTGKRRIKMAHLRELYEDLGCVDVNTYIASGNVIFTSATEPDTSRFEEAFEDRFGFPAEVFLRTKTQVKTLLNRIPWAEDDGVVEVSFLASTPGLPAARALEATAVPPEELVVDGSEVLFLRRGNAMDATHKESTSIRMLGMQTTRRGLATIRKIEARFLQKRPDGTGS